jgi:hypothetical protein
MLGKKDLVPLQGDLQHLQRDLEGIGEALKECAGSSRIKKVFMRGDILLKIKHCDTMLSHALSMFQTKVTLRIHHTQLIQGREVPRRAAKCESDHMDSFDRPEAVAVEDVPPVAPKQQRHGNTCGVCDQTFGSKRQLRRHVCLHPSSPSSGDEIDDWRVRAEEEELEALALYEAESTNGTPSEWFSENEGYMTEVDKYCIWAKQVGIARECEDDSSPATHVIMHGKFESGSWSACYLKCARCAYYRDDAVELPLTRRW